MAQHSRQKQQQQQAGSRQADPVLTCRVDYVEGTVPHTAFYDLLQLLGADLQALDRGWRGYTSSGLVAGGFGRLGWNEDPARAGTMGVHFSLGSQALQHLAAVDPRWADVAGVLATLRSWGGHVTRLDLCWDDQDQDPHGGLLDLGVMQDALERGIMTSRWRGGLTVKGWGRQEGGRTLYMGSGQSDATLRTYDKRAERIAAGHADQVEGIGHWVRVELQLRRERAQAAARVFEDVNRDPGRVHRFLAGVLRGYVNFLTPSTTDTNKRRWATAPWWSAFLGAVEKAQLLVERVQRTIQNVKDWLTRSVGPSLALVEKVMGQQDGWGFLFQVAEDGRSRWGPRHRAILAASTGGV